jgi:hypothetical protein
MNGWGTSWNNLAEIYITGLACVRNSTVVYAATGSALWMGDFAYPPNGAPGSTSGGSMPTPISAPVVTPLANPPAVQATGSTLTFAQLTKIMTWMSNDFLISNTNYCWINASQDYSRPAGTLPACASGSTNRAGICYNGCPSGWSDNGTATCVYNSCPTGYNSSGLLTCQWGSAASMVDAMHKDSNGVEHYDNCFPDYTFVAGVCWKNNPTLAKATQTEGTSIPNACPSNTQLYAGLCQQNPRPGFSCLGVTCQPTCAAGTSACGPAACANSAYACANAVSDMVISPLLVIATAASEGAVGPVTLAARQAMLAEQVAVNGEKASQIAASTSMVYGLVQNLMTVSLANFSQISSPYIAQQVTANYPIGTANYTTIVQAWAANVAIIIAGQLGLDLSLLAVSAYDPTGVMGTIAAYTQPPCQQHVPIPQN